MQKHNKLFELIGNFEKLAQEKNYDFNFRNELLNVSPAGSNFSFRQVAEVVAADLSSLDRNEADAGVTSASHALLDILNNLNVPTPQSMLNAATSSANIIKEKAPTDTQKVQVANYLVYLTQLLINKFFDENKTPGTSEQGEDDKKVPTESTVSFLQRMYRNVVQNKQLSDDDLQKWNTTKSFYVRRLNGLKGLQNLTPQQKEEYGVISTVLQKLP